MKKAMMLVVWLILGTCVIGEKSKITVADEKGIDA